MDVEWERYPAENLFDAEAEPDDATWRMCFDQSYYYFWIEAPDTDPVPQSLWIYLYGSNPCMDYLWEPFPDYSYTIRWRRNRGWAFFQWPAESGVGFDSAGEVLDSPVVTATGRTEAGRLVWEVAVPAQWIEASLGAGGDYNWTAPILLGIRLFPGGDSALGSTWPQDLGLDHVCQWGTVQLWDWPGPSVWADPPSLLFEAEAGTAETTLAVADPTAVLGVTGTVPDWVRIEITDRTAKVSVEANTSRHRQAYLLVQTADEIAASSLKVEQWGVSGTPWDFDFEDPLSGDRYSGWLSVYFWPDQSSPWLWSENHGWLYFSGLRGGSVYFYDYALGAWWWTSEDHYPWLYLWWDGAAGWYFVYRDYVPAIRWFYRAKTQEWVTLP